MRVYIYMYHTSKGQWASLIFWAGQLQFLGLVQLVTVFSLLSLASIVNNVGKILKNHPQNHHENRWYILLTNTFDLILFPAPGILDDISETLQHYFPSIRFPRK